MIVPAGAVLALSAVLFGIGMFGFLARRNIILMLISVEVMLNAVNLSLAGFSRHFDDCPIIEVSGRTYPVETRYRPLSVDERWVEERIDQLAQGELKSLRSPRPVESRAAPR